MDPLTDLDKLVIREACARQIYRYARLNDGGSWDELSMLFTESAIFCRPAEPDVPVKGRQNILQSFKARPPRLNRHVVSNVEVMVESPQRAHAVSTIVLYMAAAGEGIATIASVAVGHFHDQLVEVGGEWLFAERRGSLIMRGSSPS